MWIFFGILLTQSVSYILSLALILFSLARVQIISDRFFLFSFSYFFFLRIRLWVFVMWWFDRCCCCCFIKFKIRKHFTSERLVLFYGDVDNGVDGSRGINSHVFQYIQYTIVYALYLLVENTNYHTRVAIN